MPLGVGVLWLGRFAWSWAVVGWWRGVAFAEWAVWIDKLERCGKLNRDAQLKYVF